MSCKEQFCNPPQPYRVNPMTYPGIPARIADWIPVSAAEMGEKRNCLLPNVALDEISARLSENVMFPGVDSGKIVWRGTLEKSKMIRMLVNKSRNNASLTYAGPDGELWNPFDGTVSPRHRGEAVVIPAMRALFTVSSPK